MTKEASAAIQEVKEFLTNETMTYNIDTAKPVYLSVDASQVGVGAFLYQLKVYPKTAGGRDRMKNELGFLPDTEKTMDVHLIPGVSPGKNTPNSHRFYGIRAWKRDSWLYY